MLAIPGETFPFAPITAKQEKLIVGECTSDPVSDPTLVRNFIQVHGLPVLANVFVRVFLQETATNVLRAFDNEADPAANISINRGMLMYAGVTAKISGIGSIPYQREPISKVYGAMDGKLLGINSLQRLDEETTGFCQLMRRLREPMQTADNDQRYMYSLIGAGILHSVVTDLAELERAAPLEVSDPFRNYEDDPILAAISRQMDEAFANQPPDITGLTSLQQACLFKLYNV